MKTVGVDIGTVRGLTPKFTATSVKALVAKVERTYGDTGRHGASSGTGSVAPMP